MKPAGAQVGDGTTTVVILAGELMKECKAFIEEGVHPQVQATHAFTCPLRYGHSVSICFMTSRLLTFHYGLALSEAASASWAGHHQGLQESSDAGGPAGEGRLCQHRGQGPGRQERPAAEMRLNNPELKAGQPLPPTQGLRQGSFTAVCYRKGEMACSLLKDFKRLCTLMHIWRCL